MLHSASCTRPVPSGSRFCRKRWVSATSELINWKYIKIDLHACFKHGKFLVWFPHWSIHAMLPMAAIVAAVFCSKFCCPCTMTRKWVPPTRYTFQRNTSSIMKIWFDFIIIFPNAQSRFNRRAGKKPLMLFGLCAISLGNTIASDYYRRGFESHPFIEAGWNLSCQAPGKFAPFQPISFREGDHHRSGTLVQYHLLERVT